MGIVGYLAPGWSEAGSRGLWVELVEILSLEVSAERGRPIERPPLTSDRATRVPGNRVKIHAPYLAFY